MKSAKYRVNLAVFTAVLAVKFQDNTNKYENCVQSNSGVETRSTTANRIQNRQQEDDMNGAPYIATEAGDD